MDRQRQLDQIAAAIARLGLGVPARLLVQVAEPLDIAGSQAVGLLRPLLPMGSWRAYALLFEDPANWQALRARLTGQDY